MEASVDKGTGLDVPRCTAEKPECSVARIGRPSGRPQGAQARLGERTGSLWEYRPERRRGEERTSETRSERRDRGSSLHRTATPRAKVALRKECPSIRFETSQTEGQGFDSLTAGLHLRARGKPGGGLRAAPFLFPLPARRVGTAPSCAVSYAEEFYEGCTHLFLGG